ncbi:MAG: cytochrome [Solirubrobacterales bacterium]|nr:cytochrome [Solirubrobacterales bacterium]
MAAPPAPALSPGRQKAGWILRPEALMLRARAEVGPAFTLELPIGPAVFLADPVTIREVFTGDPEVFRAGEGNAPLEPVLGPASLLLLDGPEHLRRRRLLLPPLHGERLAGQRAAMERITAADVASWPRDVPFALEPRMRQITLGIILRLVFGLAEGPRHDELRGRFAQLLPRGAGNLALVPALRRELGGRSPWGRFMANVRAIDGVLLAEIAERRGAGDLEERTDVLSLLMTATDEDGRPLEDRELRDELMTLLLAGHETTATALAWTFELLFRHEEAYAALRADPGGPWLDAVCSEALRLRPPLPVVVRRLATRTTVAGHDLPAGTRVAPCIFLAQRDPVAHRTPHAFRPERYLGVAPQPLTWLPFGGGTRRCVGAAFAQLEHRTVLRTVLEHVAPRAADPRPDRPARRTIVLSPARGARAVV